MKGLKFRLSKKLIFIALGSVALFGGGSGAAALLIGTERLLGSPSSGTTGISCTVLATVKIRKDQRYWVRQYVMTEGQGDGPARIKAALSAAKALQVKEKADLVQVAVLDAAGPKERSRMRGRSIGAQVVYIPDTTKAPKGMSVAKYSAYYVNGAPSADGEFYGLRIDLPVEETEAMTASLKGIAPCSVEGAPAVEGHAALALKNGEKIDAGAHNESKAAHEEAPASGRASSAEPVHESADSAKVSGGFLASIKAMIFGAEEEQGPVSDEASAPRTSAEGGKRWSKSTEADAVVSAADEPPVPIMTDDGQATDADAAGAAWLSKMRGEGF